MAKFKDVEVPTVMHLEVLVMPNGEILCLGKTLGWTASFGKFLKSRERLETSLENGEIQNLTS